MLLSIAGGAVRGGRGGNHTGEKACENLQREGLNDRMKPGSYV